ncbi:MAG: TlyA family rRNA (cytidine-2'-O)-methyltransferase [Spirochaetaceae bacterium]|nr:TlyA family rRNA (cytidine-2'-O)-methyltransferase [Spirochaetaceae bacterium]
MSNTSLLALLNKRFGNDKKEENFALILCGNVLVNGAKIKDPKEKVDKNSEITIIKKKYVSRGGYKLEYALDYWKIATEGKVFVDAGSSTGGFTDCLVKRNALFVHSIDVGYNQIDYLLRNNKRVIIHEKTNIMDISTLSPPANIGVADLSFRSITNAASKILDLTIEKKLIALIKPQFETESCNLEKGVIESTLILKETLLAVIDKLFDEESFVQDIVQSPIKGTKGNREFFFLITREKLEKNEIKKLVSLVIN